MAKSKSARREQSIDEHAARVVLRLIPRWERIEALRALDALAEAARRDHDEFELARALAAKAALIANARRTGRPRRQPNTKDGELLRHASGGGTGYAWAKAHHRDGQDPRTGQRRAEERLRDLRRSLALDWGAADRPTLARMEAGKPNTLRQAVMRYGLDLRRDAALILDAVRQSGIYDLRPARSAKK